MPKKKNESEKFDWVLADLLELPKDLVLDLPRITIVGQQELALENHKGIIEYDSEQIKINLARGYLEIDGESLELKFIMQDELSIVGKIRALRFID